MIARRERCFREPGSVMPRPIAPCPGQLALDLGDRRRPGLASVHLIADQSLRRDDARPARDDDPDVA